MKSQKIGEILQFFKSNLKKIPIFEPFKKSVLLWDAIVFLISIFYIYYIPIEIGFFRQINIEILILIYSIFILEIIGKLNIGFFKHGKLILERKLIIKNYVQKNLIKDLLIIMAIVYDLIRINIFSQIKSDYWILYGSLPKLIFFTKIFKLKEIFHTLKEHFNLDEKHEGLIKLMSLIMNLLFLSHFFACLWHFVGYIGNYKEMDNWISDKNLEYETDIIRYIYSYNYSAVTM